MNTPTPGQERRREQDRWIRRYTGMFGELPNIADFRARRITFRELYDSGMKRAENMVAETQYINSIAFKD